MFGLKFLNTKRECDKGVFFERRLFRQKGDDEMARFGAPAMTISVHNSGGTKFACEVIVGGEDRDITFRFKLPFLPTVSFGVENAAKELRKKAWAWAKKQATENKAAGFRSGIYAHELDPFGGRATGVYLFENHLVFSLWKNVDAWSAEARRVAPWKHLGWSASWFVDDVLLGAAVYKEEVRDVVNTTIPMPEGDYPAEIKLVTATWARPRWFDLVVERATVMMQTPIPIPGKGENSWDCGDDAIHSLTLNATSVQEARMAVWLSASRDRARRGGPARWPTGPNLEFSFSPIDAK